MRYIVIADEFSRLQHYRRRNPPWIKFHKWLLDNLQFGRLDLAEQMQFVILCVLSSESENMVPFDVPWLARRMRLAKTSDLAVLKMQTLGLLRVVTDNRVHTEKARTRQVTEALAAAFPKVAKPK